MLEHSNCFYRLKIKNKENFCCMSSYFSCYYKFFSYIMLLIIDCVVELGLVVLSRNCRPKLLIHKNGHVELWFGLMNFFLVIPIKGCVGFQCPVELLIPCCCCFNLKRALAYTVLFLLLSTHLSKKIINKSIVVL